MNALRLKIPLQRGYNGQYCYRYCTQINNNDFPPTYNTKNAESKWYDIWEKNDYFSPKNSDKEPFTMILPPPNVTGILHLGHSLTAIIQDSLARWYRMRGHQVIWIPGLDHAGIATQVVVEKHLQKTKGISRHDLGRENFLLEVENWKNDKENVIFKQLRSFGATLDWSKEFFTMNEKHSNAVTEAFIQLAEKDLIYRDKSIVNWSPTLRSAISDIEVEYLPVNCKTDINVPGYDKKITFGQITEFSYQLRDSDQSLTVATTRPETMLGDVAIAVHPEDGRYSQYVGSHVWHPFRETFIPVIADSFVDMNFGTGAVKITPAHDSTDFQVAKRHDLEIIDVIDENGNMTSNAEPFQGLPRFLARERVMNELANRNALGLIKDHNMIVPKCSRSGDIIEYLLREQWFIRCKDMSEQAVKAVKNGTLKIDPCVHEQTWYKWLENIRDWCVSRQLWWGHRIPAYLCSNDLKSIWIVERTEREALIKAKEKLGDSVEIKIKQDEDVLDTWFSSSLLPFAALGWPDKTDDYKRFYPLSMLETGHDILFFWVARMVMLGNELTGKLPFKEILLHGILCDKEQGKKMSKSLGNVISPENITQGISLEKLNEQAKQNHKSGILSNKELQRTINSNTQMFPKGIPECGTDALRLTLSSLNIKSHNVNFDVNDCIKNKLFCNKVWQASKFVLIATEKHPNVINENLNLNIIDEWILSRLSLMVATVNEGFSQRNLHVVTHSLKHFFYREFCDWYLEATKPGMANAESETLISGHVNTLIKCLDVSLRIIAPIAPYLADELYSQLSHRIPSFVIYKSIMEAPYPTTEEFKKYRNRSVEERIEKIKTVVWTIRSLISTNKISAKICEAHIVVDSQEDLDLYSNNSIIITSLSRVRGIDVILENDYVKTENCVFDTFGSDCSIYLVFEDLNKVAEIEERITRKISLLEKDLNKLIERRSTPKYIAKAPMDVRINHSQKIDAIQEELDKLRQMKAKGT